MYQSVPETSNKIVEWTKEAIINGTREKGWSSAQNAKAPFAFVFELSEDCIIEKIGFNTDCEKQYSGICAKDVRVEFSLQDAAGKGRVNTSISIPQFHGKPGLRKCLWLASVSTSSFYHFSWQAMPLSFK